MWRRYLRFWRSNVDADVDDELRFHFETRLEELKARGLNHSEARDQTQREFGDLRATRERLAEIDRRIERRRSRHQRWDALRRDVRYAMRGLRRSPGLTVTVTLTIALGIGAAVSMYGVMRRLLIAPPPHVAEPERVVRLFRTTERIIGQPPTTFALWSYPDYENFAEQASTLAAVAAYEYLDVVVGRGPDARRVRAAAVSPGFARTLGVRATLGRFFGDDEAHPVTGSRRVVLSHAYWQRVFDGDPTVVGRVLTVKGQPYDIIGVAPRGFRAIGFTDVELWLPLFVRDDGEATPSRWYRFAGSGILTVVGRLAPGATTSQVGVETTQLVRRALQARYASRPGARMPVMTAMAGPITGAMGSDMEPLPEAKVSVWLVGTGVVLLMVACANVASLLLLRALRRRREIAVRAALGESRARLARQLMLESLMLAVLGGSAALVVVLWGGGWLHRLLLPDMAWEPASVLDGSMATATTVAILATALIAGLAPLALARQDPIGGLRDGAAHGSTRRSRTHSALLLAQAALAVVLLAGAGLFVRSMQALRAIDLGLDPEQVLAVELDFTGTGRPTHDVIAAYERALERAQALPGVQQAALVVSIPLRSARGAGFYLPGRDSVLPLPSGEYPLGNYVSTGYFATAGTRIVAGRDFTEADRTAGHVVIVNETLARFYWPGQSAVGQCVQTKPGGPCTTVIGVAENTHLFRMVNEEASLFYYRPLDPSDPDERALLVRVHADAIGPMGGTIRHALQELEPSLPYVHITTLEYTLDPQMRPWRLGASVFGAFALLAVVLAAIGLFGAVGFAVAQRTREIGVRVAVGASARDVVVLVLRDGLRVIVGGVLAGFVVALLAGPLLADLVYGVSPRDAGVFTGVAMMMLLVAVVASVVPAWRALRIDPVTALRAD